MFGFFQKKKPKNQFVAMLELDDFAYVRLIDGLFANMDSATRVHVLVAYENLNPIFAVAQSEAKKQGEHFTVEQIIPQVAERLEKAGGDEIGSRRWAWFMFALLLRRLVKLSENNQQFADVGANIWCAIADSTPMLKALLPNNVVWKPEEKEWFDLTVSDEHLVQWTINHAMPSVFAKLEYVKLFAHSRGLFYFPSKSSI